MHTLYLVCSLGIVTDFRSRFLGTDLLVLWRDEITQTTGSRHIDALCCHSHILCSKVVVYKGLSLNWIFLTTHWIKLANQRIQSTVEFVWGWSITVTHRSHNKAVLLL